MRDVDLLSTLALAGFTVAVVVGVRRLRASGGRYPWWRGVCLATGVMSALAVLDGPIGRQAHALMSVLSTQDLVLLLLAPALLVFGRPLDPLRLVCPAFRLPRAAQAVVRGVGHPTVGPLLVPVVLGVLVFTPALSVSASRSPSAAAVHLLLIGVGVAIAAPLARTPEGTSSLALGLALAVGLIELLLDAGPGFALRMTDQPLPTVAALAAARGGAPSAIFDQHLAGAILWSVAEALDLPFLLIVLRQWMRADAAEARQIDDALDRAATPDRDVASNATDAGRPWWESDAEVFGERRARGFTDDGG